MFRNQKRPEPVADCTDHIFAYTNWVHGNLIKDKGINWSACVLYMLNPLVVTMANHNGLIKLHALSYNTTHFTDQQQMFQHFLQRDILSMQHFCMTRHNLTNGTSPMQHFCMKQHNLTNRTSPRSNKTWHLMEFFIHITRSNTTPVFQLIHKSNSRQGISQISWHNKGTINRPTPQQTNQILWQHVMWSKLQPYRVPENPI
jgi:hypothetical protein